MRLVWSKGAWRCSAEGPHGPTPCAPVPYDLSRCACGCTDFYISCDLQRQWFEEQQKKVADARQACKGCGKKHPPPWCQTYEEEK